MFFSLSHHDTTQHSYTELLHLGLGELVPGNTRSKYHKALFGSEISFLDALGSVSAAKPALLKYFVDGARIELYGKEQSDLVTDSGTTNAFDGLSQSIDKFQEDLQRLGYEISWKGMVWYQGESDSNAQNAPLYKDRLTTLIENVRTYIGVPDLPVVISDPGHEGGL